MSETKEYTCNVYRNGQVVGSISINYINGEDVRDFMDYVYNKLQEFEDKDYMCAGDIRRIT